MKMRFYRKVYLYKSKFTEYESKSFNHNGQHKRLACDAGSRKNS